MDARLNDTFSTGQPLAPRPDRGTSTLVQQHLQLINRIARMVFVRMSSALPVEDLVQIGLIALLEADAVFEDRGVAQFATYASLRIRGAMIDELRRSATISRQARRNRREFGVARAQLANHLGHQPSEAQMAAQVDLSLADYRAAMSATQSIRYESIDATYSDHSAWFADSGPDALDMIESDKLRKAVAEAITELPEREGIILQLYFVEEWSLEAIGRTLDVSAARVCQIKRIALGKIRRRLAAWN